MIIRKKKTGGKKENPLRKYLRCAYKLSPKQLKLVMPWADQLARCQSDEARRLLLGVSEKLEMDAPEKELVFIPTVKTERPKKPVSAISEQGVRHMLSLSRRINMLRKEVA